jgi:hypothetical protein
VRSFITCNASPNIVRVTRSKKWLGHVAHVGEMRMHTRFWLGNLNRRDNAEDLATDGRIILE